MAGKFHTPETRLKMSRSQSGRKVSEETKRRISETKRKKQMKPPKTPKANLPMPVKTQKAKTDDMWTEANEELDIPRELKKDKVEFNKPKNGKKPLIRFPVQGILRCV